MGRLAFVLVLLLLTACRQGGPLDLEELKGRARTGDADACRELVRLLGEEGQGLNSKVYPAVLELGERAVPYLLEEVGTEDRIRREHVVAALGSLKARQGAQAVARVLADRKLERRYVAAWALGEIGDPSTVPTLVAALDDPDAEVRRHAVRALIRFGSEAVPPLVSSLSGASPRGAAGAVRALGDIGDLRAVEPLLALAAGPLRQEVFPALGKLKDPRAEAALVAGLSDPEWRTRMNAAMALGHLGGPGAVPALRVTLEDEVAVVREWSARSLETITGSRVTYRNEKGKMVLPYSIYH